MNKPTAQHGIPLEVLGFKDGFLDDATVQKVYENLDFQRVVQVFLTGMSAASPAANRKGFRPVSPDNQIVLNFETLTDSRSPRAVTGGRN